MRLNFRKITSVLSCGIMAVSTIGFAAAASYPMPFVSGGSADVAIVYGTGSGVSSLDVVQANNIAVNLQSSLTGGTSGSTSSASGGDSVKLEKSSTKFQLGEGISDVVSTSITSDSPNGGLPTLLADGTYVDTNNDEHDYTQKIDLANLTFTMFDDDDYKTDTPTLGMRVASGAHVLNYSLEFTDEPEWADIDSTNIDIMGKNYFVLSHTANTTINLLDAAQTATLSEGESTTVNGHDVSISFIGGSGSDAEVKLNVDGEVTNSLNEGDTQKLSNGDYVGVKDISVQDYAGGVKTVEFSIGNGKLVLKDGVDVEMNDDSISDLTSYITTTAGATGTINKIVIQWDAEDDMFVTPDSSIEMPGFKAVKLSMADMYTPVEEPIVIQAGSTTYAQLKDFPLKSSTEDINILYGNSSDWQGVGKESGHLLTTQTNATTLTYDKDTDDYFVASYNDGSNAESYLMRATSFGLVSGSVINNQTTIQYKKDGTWTDLKSGAKDDDVVSIGNVELTITDIKKSPANSVIITGGSHVQFNMLYYEQGMQVYLPYEYSVVNYTASGTGKTGALETNTTGIGYVVPTTLDLVFAEEDKNGNIGQGKNVTATLGWNSATTKEASVTTVSGNNPSFAEIGSTEHYQSYVYSALATALDWDKSGDQNKLTLTYHGGESYGEFYLTSPGATITPGESGTSGSGTQIGEVLVKDTQVSSVSSRNLIVVGGSCINSAAASVLGVAQHTCGADFTTATGVGSGQFLIKGVSGAYSTGKIALVVAGYEAADTVNAATYLTTQTVDTSKEYKGTSSTSATLVTTSA